MVGLLYLKEAFNQSDESPMNLWVENPYWQAFCGFQYMQHNAPIDPSSLIRHLTLTCQNTTFDNTSAQRNALHWLNQNGFDASKATVSISKFTGKPYGLKMGNNIGFRVEIDMRFGAHINVFSGKQKGPHYLFNWNASAVDSILRQLFGD